MVVISFLRFIRWPNLVIAALTQYLLQYLVIVPALKEAGLNPLLDGPHFGLLVLTTLIIAAGGYIINDILDYECDLVNKPQAVFVNNIISRKGALFFYIILSLFGLGVAWYLANFVQNRWLVLIYPGAVLLLYFYSKSWKKLPLLGNIVVSLFCAMVAGIVLYAERERFGQLDWGRGGRGILFTAYLVFAFMSTLFREIIKDIEDVDGDAKIGIKTLPLYFGIKNAKYWSVSVGFCLLLLILVFLSHAWKLGEIIPFYFGLFALVPVLGFAIFKVVQAKSKQDYSRISLLLKIVMLEGLVLLVLGTIA